MFNYADRHIIAKLKTGKAGQTLQSRPRVILSIVSKHSVSYNNTIGPSGVRALPLAAGRNEGGHYFR